jgi:hypothetical protein
VNVDYESLEQDLITGVFRERLEGELVIGFREMHRSGERLPPASYYASQIAEIVNHAADEPLDADLSFNLYQEILMACERARAAVLGEKPN